MAQEILSRQSLRLLGGSRFVGQLAQRYLAQVVSQTLWLRSSGIRRSKLHSTTSSRTAPHRHVHGGASRGDGTGRAGHASVSCPLVQPGRPVDLRSLPTGNVDIALNTVRARKRAGSAQDEGTNLGVVPVRDRSVRFRVAVFQGVAVCHTARSALGHSASHHVYVGLAGLEPATSCTQSTRASQAALQPVPPEDNRHFSDSFYGKEVTGGKPIPATPLSRVAARASSQCNGSLVRTTQSVGHGSLCDIPKDGCDGIRGGGVLLV